MVIINHSIILWKHKNLSLNLMVFQQNLHCDLFKSCYLHHEDGSATW